MLEFFWNAPYFILQMVFVILFWSGVIFGGYVLGKELLDNYVEKKAKSKMTDPNTIDDDDYIGV